MSGIGKITAGSLSAYVATKPEEIKASQELRYRVFVEEMGAKASPKMQAEKRDFDEFDDICDHLLVVDTENDKVVGSYRLLRRSQIPEGRGFYTESEYDIAKMVNHFEGDVMELGRSCVDVEFRNRASMQLLWRAISTYVQFHKVELLFGCASLPGSDSKQHAEHLTYLYHNHLAPEEIRPRVLEKLYKPMDLVDPATYDDKRIIASLPPLVKGYLRLGGYIGDGAFEDHEYNTTDVCIVMKTATITKKYIDRYNEQNAKEQ